jgi:hypothetical protein
VQWSCEPVCSRMSLFHIKNAVSLANTTYQVDLHLVA